MKIKGSLHLAQDQKKVHPRQKGHSIYKGFTDKETMQEMKYIYTSIRATPRRLVYT